MLAVGMLLARKFLELRERESNLTWLALVGLVFDSDFLAFELDLLFSDLLLIFFESLFPLFGLELVTNFRLSLHFW